MKFDIVISSCKKDQFVLQKAIESIKEYIKGYRRIIVVSNEKLTEIENVEWFDEKKYPFTMKDMYDYMDKIVPDEKRRRKVSYINQLIKLYAHKVIPDLLDNILIYDSDIVFIKETTFFEDDKPLYGNRIVNLDPYQPYLNHNLQLDSSFDFGNKLDINKKLKKTGKFCSGICHHMIFNKTIINEIIDFIEKRSGEIFWKYFLTNVTNKNINHCEPSEYELYYNYVNIFHNSKIKIRPITWMEEAAGSGQQNKIITSYSNRFESIKEQALAAGHNYIAFHSYNRELYRDKITFCTVCDNNFFEGLKILVYSLYKNIPNFLNYEFIVFVSKRINVVLKDEYINELLNNFKNVKIKEINVEEYSLGHVLVPTQRASFLTIESFNINSEKVIFLDSDIICLKNILDVFDINSHLCVCGGKSNENKFVNDKHFNAGVIFINNLKNRKNIYENLLLITKNKPSTGINTDQWVFNTYFNEMIKLDRYMLSQDYNFREWGGIGIDESVIVDNENLIKNLEDLEKIKLLHYSGYRKRLKPWDEKTKTSQLLAYKIWWEYRTMYDNEFNKN